MQSIMGRAWASGGIDMGWWQQYMYTLNYNSPNQNADIHLRGFGWKRARKSFWTRWACWRVQCSHVCMTSWLWMEHCWNSGSCGSICCCSLHNTLLKSQFSSSRGFNCQPFARWLVLLCCNVISPRVSTANFAYWLVLACCNLQSLLEFSAASLSLIRCNFVSLSSEVSFPLNLSRKVDAVKWLVFH